MLILPLPLVDLTMLMYKILFDFESCTIFVNVLYLTFTRERKYILMHCNLFFLLKWLSCYAEKIASLGIFSNHIPNHVLVNEYTPGQGIMVLHDMNLISLVFYSYKVELICF